MTDADPKTASASPAHHAGNRHPGAWSDATTKVAAIANASVAIVPQWNATPCGEMVSTRWIRTCSSANRSSGTAITTESAVRGGLGRPNRTTSIRTGCSQNMTAAGTARNAPRTTCAGEMAPDAHIESAPAARHAKSCCIAAGRRSGFHSCAAADPHMRITEKAPQATSWTRCIIWSPPRTQPSASDDMPRSAPPASAQRTTMLAANATRLAPWSWGGLGGSAGPKTHASATSAERSEVEVLTRLPSSVPVALHPRCRTTARIRRGRCPLDPCPVTSVVIVNPEVVPPLLTRPGLTDGVPRSLGEPVARREPLELHTHV